MRWHRNSSLSVLFIWKTRTSSTGMTRNFPKHLQKSWKNCWMNSIPALQAKKSSRSKSREATYWFLTEHSTWYHRSSTTSSIRLTCLTTKRGLQKMEESKLTISKYSWMIRTNCGIVWRTLTASKHTSKSTKKSQRSSLRTKQTLKVWVYRTWPSWWESSPNKKRWWRTTRFTWNY